ncbi:F-box protein SKIP24 [Nymphaea colorata]|nr:F-box protein SKIP24 [Nymphaea colorata]
MAELPDEIWLRILDTGVRERGLTFQDLCCLSISCRRLDRLSKEEPLWSALLAMEFPLQTVSASKSRLKDVFRIKFERHKALKLAAHRREVLNVESRIASGSRELDEANRQLMAETGKLDVALKELKDLKRARQASVALNVWQPEVVRARQKQIVEQHPVPMESRMHALEMEIRVCKQQIARFSRRAEALRQRLDASKEYLSHLKYHPLRSSQSIADNEGGKVKWKMVKLQGECSGDKVVDQEETYPGHNAVRKRLKM